MSKRDTPSINQFPDCSIRVEVVGTPQRLFSEYEKPSDVKMLDEIVIESKKIEAEDRTTRPYGKANYTLSSKNIQDAYGNLLYAIVGKVPGLVVDPSTNSVGFTRSISSSISSAGTPMVTVDNVPMTGNAGEILAMLDPATVESIDFTNSLNVLYGSQGVFGVIAVHTKQGVLYDPKNPDSFGAFSKSAMKVEAQGYATGKEFRYPKYDQSTSEVTQPDYRSTVFWDPNVKIKPGLVRNEETGLMESENIAETSVSFYATDLIGPYRVVIEGVTSEGEFIHAQQVIVLNK